MIWTAIWRASSTKAIEWMWFMSRNKNHLWSFISKNRSLLMRTDSALIFWLHYKLDYALVFHHRRFVTTYVCKHRANFMLIIWFSRFLWMIFAYSLETPESYSEIAISLIRLSRFAFLFGAILQFSSHFNLSVISLTNLVQCERHSNARHDTLFCTKVEHKIELWLIMN